MVALVGIHGIGQQFAGEDVVASEWLPALRSGLRRGGYPAPDEVQLSCVFYGDIFRRKGTMGSREIPFDASDVDSWEAELLAAWWEQASNAEPDRVRAPGDATMARTPQVVQRALNALSASKFFAGLADQAMIADLKQVHAYVADPQVRAEVLARVSSVVESDTRVLIGHSLGSVVAYEALCAHPEWPVHTLVTLGSPLGIRNLIFGARLRPPPEDGVGVWPGATRRWCNIADRGDVVALEKRLASRFGEQVEDVLIYNGASAHSASRYLTAEETGRVFAVALGR